MAEEANSQLELLIAEVHQVQIDPAIRQKWQHYCTIFGNNERNPAQHNETFLSGFLQGLQSAPTEDTQIFVGGLPHDATEEILLQYFSQWGEITNVKMMHGKGFGFVTFGSMESVNHVLQNRDVHQINGKFIDCKRKQNTQDIAIGMQPQPMLMQQPPSYGPARLITRPQIGPYQQLGIDGQPTFLQKPRGPALDGVVNATEIFCGGLPADATEDTLLQYFSQFGEVTKIDLKMGKGYAFLGFSSPDTVESICALVGQHQINGKLIDCKKRVLDAHQQARLGGGGTVGVDAGNAGFIPQPMGMIQQHGQQVPLQTQFAAQQQIQIQQNQFAKLPNPEPGQICSNKIFAGGLPRGTQEGHLLEAFSAFGSVQKIDLKNEKGFAFIHFDDPNSALLAIQQPIAIGDKFIDCKQADNRPSKMQVYGGMVLQQQQQQQQLPQQVLQ